MTFPCIKDRNVLLGHRSGGKNKKCIKNFLGAGTGDVFLKISEIHCLMI